MNRAQRRAARSNWRATNSKLERLLKRKGTACCICGAVFTLPCKTYVGHASSGGLVEVGECCRSALKDVICDVDLAAVSPNGMSVETADYAWFAENMPRSHRIRAVWPGEFSPRVITKHSQVIVRQVTPREYERVLIVGEGCMEFPDDEGLLHAAFDLAIEDRRRAFTGREILERAAWSVAIGGFRT